MRLPVRSKAVLPFLVLALLSIITAGSALAQDATEEPVADACLAPEAEATEVAAAPDNSDVSFAIILPAARGDRSFIDSAARGAERAIAELGVDGTIIETAGTQEHD